MNPLDKILFDFYALKQSKVLVFPNSSTPSEDASDKFRLFMLSLTYKIENHKELLSYPLVLRDLCDAISNGQKSTILFEQSIMDRSFFVKVKPKNILEMIQMITDTKLLERLKEATALYEECLICMSEKSDSFTECGHSMCKGCYSMLTKQECPFCRNKIAQVFSKEEYSKIQSLAAEEKKRLILEFGIEPQEVPEKKLKRLTIVHDVDEFINKRVKSLFAAGTGKLNQQTQDEINVLIVTRHKLIVEAISKSVSSEELASFTIGKLCLKISPPKKATFVDEEQISYQKDGQAKELINSIVLAKINTPNRLLRFLAVMGGFEPTPDEKICFKLCNAWRVVVMQIIDKFEHKPETIEQITKHLPIWKSLTRYLHAGVYKKFVNAQKLVTGIRGDTPFPCRPNSSVLEELFQNEDVALFDFLEKNPGLFFRNVIRICCTFPNNGKEIEKLSRLICPKLKPEQMLELNHVLQRSTNYTTCYVTKRGTFKFIDNNTAKYHVANQKVVSHVLRECMNIKKISDVEYCILDKKLTRYLISKGPVQDPILNLPKIPSSRGSTVDLSEILKIPDVEIVFFQYWKNGKDSIDLDLSFLGLDTNLKMGRGQYCDFTNLKGFNGAAQHSGDITNAPKGASEFIRFKWDAVVNKNPTLQYMVMVCFSFNGVPFEEMGEAYCGIGYKTDKIKGDGPFGCHVIDGCRLKGECQTNIPAFIDVAKKEVTFMSVNIKKKSGGYIAVQNSHGLIGAVVSHFLEWKKTPSAPVNWYELGLNILTFYPNVLVLDKGFKYFARGEKENVIEFCERVRKGEKTDEIPKKLLENLKEGKEFKEDAKPWIYFGPASKIKLPKKSIVVSPDFTDDPDINYLDDPFKVLHFK